MDQFNPQISPLGAFVGLAGTGGGHGVPCVGPQAWAEGLQAQKARALDEEFMQLISGGNAPPSAPGGEVPGGEMPPNTNQPNPNGRPPCSQECSCPPKGANTTPSGPPQLPIPEIASSIGVSPKTGNLFGMWTDLFASGGGGFPLQIMRFYNSISSGFIPEPSTEPFARSNWHYNQDIGLYRVTGVAGAPFVTGDYNQQIWYHCATK